MDAALALTFLVGGVITFVTLFFVVWLGSILLIFKPHWMATRVVKRFWPERPLHPNSERRYRFTGGVGLCLALFVTWEIVGGLFAR